MNAVIVIITCIIVTVRLFNLSRYVCVVLKRYVEGSNRKSHVYLAEKRLMDTLFARVSKRPLLTCDTRKRIR